MVKQHSRVRRVDCVRDCARGDDIERERAKVLDDDEISARDGAADLGGIRGLGGVDREARNHDVVRFGCALEPACDPPDRKAELVQRRRPFARLDCDTVVTT